MSIERTVRGSLFAWDFLTESVARLDDWQALGDDRLDALAGALRAVFARFPTGQTPNESQTEDDLIWPVLEGLGWTASLRQQNLSARGRDDVPDGLLFANAAAKERANGFGQEWQRYQFGLAVLEAKRWQRPLDRRSGRAGEQTAPSTQMLRYLRRVDDLTAGRLRWGILTNGAKWRLYYAGARSVSEQFFELDLAAALGPDMAEDERRHCLKLFALFFGPGAFVSTADRPSLHQRALEQGRFYEERVAADLSDLVFTQVFPKLARAIAGASPDAPLSKVRDAALTLLYRLLFILYAEDRSLLPVRDTRYDDYGLRDRVRDDVRRRKDRDDTFSASAARYWSIIDDLCQALDRGDASIGLPAYNGGLFDRERTPLLARIRLCDRLMADVIDDLSFERTDQGRRYINYRDLSVQQLGSIYERLLEHEIVREGGQIVVRPNVFARKGSGSYYTPDALVNLLLTETLEPLVRGRGAEQLLELKVCDPAMGSGHFLVSLVDYLADRVIAALAEAEAGGQGRLGDRIEAIRRRITANAKQHGWSIDPEQLDDRHIVRRMVLKRCVYGVDKNPMAVELAKVSLWLHTFTVGAPLSFLDHHLRCGNSLFGCWVSQGIDRAMTGESALYLAPKLRQAAAATARMQEIEALTDVEIAEARHSAHIFDAMQESTAPLESFLSLSHALDWLNLKAKDERAAVRAFTEGRLGDPIQLALGAAEPRPEHPASGDFAAILERAAELIAEEGFLHWQVAFPGVWQDWQRPERQGGFDAVIGNPPWDRIKLQQVEWFAARRPAIAHAQRAADRKRMIAALEADGDPLSGAFERANARAESTARMARTGGDYPLLSGGDVNLYALFVERALALVKPDGMVGLLVPSGIASDKTAAPFFRSVATQGRLRALYDFENRRTRYNAPPFFPDVHSRFKFCAFITGRSPSDTPAQCAFFLQDVSELNDATRRFPLASEDFARVNPNTGTAPIFRTRRDAELTTAIYRRLPVLVDRSSGEAVKAWPVKHATMFHMANDSHLFRTREELEEQEGAYRIGGNHFDSPSGRWLPLYEGKMVQAFDHRAASVAVNPSNLHRPGQPMPSTSDQHRDTGYLPAPQFWVLYPTPQSYIAYKMVTAPTNSRTFIAALLPPSGSGHSMDVLLPEEDVEKDFGLIASLLLGNLNSIPFDFVIRQKIQGQNISWYIVEQLPIVPPETYNTVHFGPKTAGQIVREAVLELTCTAHDMAPFARDLGHVDAAGRVKPPFVWDEDRRLHLRAKLDAVFFHLYGLTDRDDVRYIYATFPIVERQEQAIWGSYRSRELCLAWLNALAAGHPDAPVEG